MSKGLNICLNALLNQGGLKYVLMGFAELVNSVLFGLMESLTSIYCNFSPPIGRGRGSNLNTWQFGTSHIQLFFSKSILSYAV